MAVAIKMVREDGVARVVSSARGVVLAPERGAPFAPERGAIFAPERGLTLARQSNTAPAPDARPALRREDSTAPRWRWESLAGRLVEVSAAPGGGGLSWAMGLVREAQQANEITAWVGMRDSVFFPPDAAVAGVDLEALAVVRVPDSRAVGRSAERLARSGGFGLIVLDLMPNLAEVGAKRGWIAPPLQSLLASHGARHRTAIVCLTEKWERAPSLGPLVSLRAHVGVGRLGAGRFRGRLAVSKDKRGGPGWSQEEVFHGAPGLR